MWYSSTEEKDQSIYKVSAKFNPYNLGSVVDSSRSAETSIGYLFKFRICPRPLYVQHGRVSLSFL